MEGEEFNVLYLIIKSLIYGYHAYKYYWKKDIDEGSILHTHPLGHYCIMCMLSILFNHINVY